MRDVPAAQRGIAVGVEQGWPIAQTSMLATRAARFSPSPQIHAALLFALLNLSGTIKLADPQSALKIINLSTNPPPPPPAVALPQPKPKEKEGGAAPKNIRSEATPVVAPKPRSKRTAVQQDRRERSRRARERRPRRAPRMCWSRDRRGRCGEWHGSGSGGSGPGGGGDNGVAEPPHLATPGAQRPRHSPATSIDPWPRRATVFMRLRVDPRGYVANAPSIAEPAIPAIDSDDLCNIAHAAPALSPGAESQRPGGCRLVRIRAASAAIATAAKHDKGLA